jgi:hypothetical protein
MVRATSARTSNNSKYKYRTEVDTPHEHHTWTHSADIPDSRDTYSFYTETAELHCCLVFDHHWTDRDLRDQQFSILNIFKLIMV